MYLFIRHGTTEQILRWAKNAIAEVGNRHGKKSKGRSGEGTGRSAREEEE